jgi:hypothetical protein
MMTVTAITLADPDSGYSVPLMPADGVAAQVLDVNTPARGVTEDRVAARGAVDNTRYSSAAAVSLSLILFPGLTQTPELFMDSLGPLLDPGLRPVLIVSNDQWATDRQLTLRYDSTAKPFSDPTNWPVQLSFQAPDAVWESAVLTSADLPTIIASTTGFEFDPSTGAVITSAGYVFPATSQASPSQVVSIGTTTSDWQALLYGPCTGPRLSNDTANGSLNFTTDLKLNLGDYVLVDSQTQTAYLNSDVAAPVTKFIDFPASDWWLMQPGLNILRYHPQAADSGAQAQLNFRAAWPA